MFDGGIISGHNPTNFVGKQKPATHSARMHGVTKACCISYEALYYSTDSGNVETLEVCNKNDDLLLPVAVLNPKNYIPGGDYISSVIAPNFKMICLAPQIQNWAVNCSVAREILREADRFNIPVQFIVDATISLSDIVSIASEVEVKILIRWFGRGCYDFLSEFHAAGLACPNLYFDVGAVTQSGGIKYLAEKIGSNRLYICSNTPEFYTLPSLFLLESADLSDADYDNVSHGTLNSIFNLSNTKQCSFVKPHIKKFNDLIKRPKIDTHWHTGTWNIVEPMIDFAKLAETQKKFGCKAIVTSSVLALNCDMERGNAETENFVNIYDHAYGYVVVNPLDVEGSIKQIQKYSKNQKFIGFKTIQDFYNLSLDSSGYEIILEAISSTGMPILAHLPGLAEAAKKHPNCRFIAAHSTWRYKHLLDLPNVWFDLSTSTSKVMDVSFEKFFADVPRNRILFSCDSQLISPAWTLGKIAELSLGEDEYAKIFFLNALDVFDRLSDCDWSSP